MRASDWLKTRSKVDTERNVLGLITQPPAKYSMQNVNVLLSKSSIKAELYHTSIQLSMAAMKKAPSKNSYNLSAPTEEIVALFDTLGTKLEAGEETDKELGGE